MFFYLTTHAWFINVVLDVRERMFNEKNKVFDYYYMFKRAREN